jgi:hypothetical protein
MDNIIELYGNKAHANTDLFFGGCPHCGGMNYVLNVGRDHWVTCDRHKTKWKIGSNLFSSWQNETEADWTRNSYHLTNYRSVEPILR